MASFQLVDSSHFVVLKWFFFDIVPIAALTQ